MTREDAISKAKSIIHGTFGGANVSESTDEYTGETFISIDDDRVYYGKAFKDLAAKLNGTAVAFGGLRCVFRVRKGIRNRYCKETSSFKRSYKHSLDHCLDNDRYCHKRSSSSICAV